MEGFQRVVLYSAIVILIIALVIIGIMLSYAKEKQSWPPIVPDCPDYWSMDDSDNNATCINVKDLGSCPKSGGNKHLSVNFNEAPYIGSKGACEKYNWAKRCGISWDGITYGVNNPCQDS
jgi:hypothetical protein